MIRLSKIDDKLSIFQGKTIILYGAERRGREVKTALEKLDFPISFYCDDRAELWGTEYEGIPVISPERLNEIYDRNRTLIQITSKADEHIQSRLCEMSILEYVSYEEFRGQIERLAPYKIYVNSESGKEAVKNCLRMNDQYFEIGKMAEQYEYALNVQMFGLPSYNVLCLPPKTGDNTLMKSLFALHLRGAFFHHSYKYMTDTLRKAIGDTKIKVITAVRDVISQNISLFFQVIGNAPEHNSFIFLPEYWREGGNIQVLFDIFVDKFITYANAKKNDIFIHIPEGDCAEGDANLGLLQSFFEARFEPYSHIDVFQYPFDKEKGYTVIDVPEENTEVFIYQLEKLNEIKDELGHFLGIQNLELVNDNVGENKWYADAYRQAKKELKFSRKYFDDCYSSKVMTHFYSEADIEKFKARWISHVVD